MHPNSYDFLDFAPAAAPKSAVLSSAASSSAHTTSKTPALRIALLLTLTALSPATLAGLPSAAPTSGLEAELDRCFREKAASFALPKNLLRAIAHVESSGNPRAVAGPKGHEDLGLMQINSAWLARWNLTREALLTDVCLNIDVASRILKDNLQRYPNIWEAVGAYNAGCTRLKGTECTAARQKYAWRVYRAWRALEKPPRASPG